MPDDISLLSDTLYQTLENKNFQGFLFLGSQAIKEVKKEN